MARAADVAMTSGSHAHHAQKTFRKSASGKKAAEAAVVATVEESHRRSSFALR